MYEKSITREHRSAFVVLIDQSGSMSEPVEYDGRTTTKADAVAEVTNLIIGELIERARRHDGVRDYYDIGVVGYSGECAESMLGVSTDILVPVTDIAKRQVQSTTQMVERVNKEGVVFRQEFETKMWVHPRARGETPMFDGLNLVYNSIKEWCARPENWDSFPPTIFNITDGESSDCTGSDMLNMARRIRSLSTSDGKVFMINVHITSDLSQPSMIFPTPDEVKECSNSYAKNLILASSTMPEIYNDIICDIRGDKSLGEFIGVSYNTSMAELITILNIGTVSVKKG